LEIKENNKKKDILVIFDWGWGEVTFSRGRHNSLSIEPNLD
jgi:hypothetical protein